MASETYDIITVGGGLGGSTLAKVMAEHGARVLVLEREKQFKDRIRGEGLGPWGVAELQALGVYDLLRETCGHEVPWGDIYLDSVQIAHRDMVATSPQKAPLFTFPHPTMQEILLQAAADTGATVHRGVSVREVQPGTAPTVVAERDGRRETFQARLVVGADGRSSLVRKWAGFPIQQDPESLLIGGVLFADMPLPSEEVLPWWINSQLSRETLFFPLGQGRVRAYLGYHRQANPVRLQGEKDLPRFIEESIRTGAPAEYYKGARAIGPLAMFEGADTWVDHPYKDGVVLIGDAASASDPTWGQGLSLTARDVRVLRDHLLAHDDWEAAGHAYAAEHDWHYGVIHRLDNWMREVFLEYGPEANARRARVFPLIAQDGTRVPDHVACGPEVPADETARRRFFGEE